MRKRGVTLIMVAGVLAVLSALGAGFYVIAISQQKSAMRYADSVRAELMAQAGIRDGMARLRDSAYQKIEDASDSWYTTDYLHGAAKQISFPAPDHTLKDKSGAPLKLSYSRSLQNSTGDPGSDNFTLEITDASSKINVNACDNLGVLLDNLCRVIGAPLVAADIDHLQPRVWSTLGANGYNTNPDDIKTQGACYYMPTKSDNLHIDPLKLPKLNTDSSALYGDGYAIARYRAANGKFKALTDVKSALTVLSRPTHPELETLERELKYAAIQDYITIDSWVDTNTVCTGKFEWINGNYCIDRDKSWIEDDPTDTKNLRGSLRGCYLSILTGQGAGQLRRIETNGIDWIKINPGFTKVTSQGGQPIEPGPLSTYMIVAKERAQLDSPIQTTFPGNPTVQFPSVDTAGNLIDDPTIDYDRNPLCIHRAPININTASDKVLTAMFMGINITHAHYMSIGTDVDQEATYNSWYKPDPNKRESRISTLQGLKRIPVSTGKIIYDKTFTSIVPTLPAGYSVNYMNNYGSTPNKGNVTEAHDLALRVLMARQSPVNAKTGLVTPAPDPFNALNSKNKAGYSYNYMTGSFKSWDDFYFRVVHPWDQLRADPLDTKHGLCGAMIMAQFNSNTDILKFNPGIEWIDRWGRNFTEMESIMAYDGTGNPIYLSNINDPNYGTNYSTYIVRNMRYKADEMIDKTDLNRATTEFCFDSGGIFQIRSTGRVVKDGVVMAERKLEALVQIYDVWRETTQAQFVQGTISPAANNAPDGAIEDFNRSGKIVRDSTNNTTARLALDTLPEPLVPYSYKLNANGRNRDVVDSAAPNGRSVYGVVRPGDGTPDVVWNHIQPASYDGQIVLATNTSRYSVSNEEKNTFLASFNGDLDTDTSVGNGREQAKSPADRTTRVLDTCSLLGVLNDTDDKHVDYDLQDGTAGNYNTFPLPAFSAGLTPLKATNYWDCVTCRQGDLRAEGVWLGYCGVSGNEGTMKYLIDVSGGTGASAVRKNFVPEDGSGATNGMTVCMWAKTVWPADDNKYHEFLNADNPGNAAAARYFALVKGQGQPQTPDSNAFTASFEDQSDNDCQGALFGGQAQDPTTKYKNTPAFRIQPFRWVALGGMYKYNTPVTHTGDFVQSGNPPPLEDPTSIINDASNLAILQICRPFISTARDPVTKQALTEGTLWNQKWFTSRLDATFTHCDIGASVSGAAYNQQAAWDWADGGGGGAAVPVFGCNNLNKSPPMWLYRYTPIDGTMAVIDEYKLSKTMFSPALAAKVMSASRYYLPTDPSDSGQCPYFTSQSLLHSLRGSNGSKATIDSVTPIRVAWNCFTPRFMHEAIPAQNPLGGPFKYEQYNLSVLNPAVDDIPGDPYGVLRPTLQDYLKKGTQSFAVSGIEVEILNGSQTIAGSTEQTPGHFVNKSTFTDPNVLNRFPVGTKPVSVQNLHYRVRFRYPIDPNFGGGTINSSQHYMLDTPVFDDISVTYTIPARIINFSIITE